MSQKGKEPVCACLWAYVCVFFVCKCKYFSVCVCVNACVFTYMHDMHAEFGSEARGALLKQLSTT